MTTATRQIPIAQWRLLNGIAAKPGGNARHLSVAANASLDDLLELEEVKFIQVATPGGRQIPLDTVTGGLGFARLHLTTKGRVWVEDSPSNCVLRHLAMLAKFRAPLVDTAKKVGVDGDVFFALEGAGLIEVTIGGEHVRLTADMLRRPRVEVEAKLTLLGRSVARGVA